MLSHARLQSIIWTADIDAARDFYQKTLGLALTAMSDGALVFDVGGSDLRVSPVPSTTPSAHTVPHSQMRRSAASRHRSGGPLVFQ